MCLARVRVQLHLLVKQIKEARVTKSNVNIESDEPSAYTAARTTGGNGVKDSRGGSGEATKEAL
jgi:hypothetical protein